MSQTTHMFISDDARRLSAVDASPTLIVTSPPYPMISMWDQSFAEQSPEIAAALESEDGQTAWASMHDILDEVWFGCRALLPEGGLICVNIGDAVRTIGGRFQLFANAARVTRGLEQSGFSLLPQIIWRKPTNSPTKFMGSGMLPGGAYVTLEHEVIVIGRKGGLRRPTNEPERVRRRNSAVFWEERNTWYSDLWTLQGVRQELPTAGVTGRSRSAAFPFELAYRLIAMHSWVGDLVLDPFAGTGTTAAAAMALGRSSICVDRDSDLIGDAVDRLVSKETLRTVRSRTEARMENHREFVRTREKAPAHNNDRYQTPVVTAQETELELPMVSSIRLDHDTGSIVCEYESTESATLLRE